MIKPIVLFRFAKCTHITTGEKKIRISKRKIFSLKQCTRVLNSWNTVHIINVCNVCIVCRPYYNMIIDRNRRFFFLRNSYYIYQMCFLLWNVSEFLEKELDEYVAKLPVPTRVIRSSKRVGLIKARLMGARQANGKILVFLDAHCECTLGT